jgi:demethylmenaquinone methyltransferase / 2-methoxy-6-polyprenyl-1,4-benzoquinol methylase
LKLTNQVARPIQFAIPRVWDADGANGTMPSVVRGIPRDPPFAPSNHLPQPLFMEATLSMRSRHARQLFAGIAISYERVATVLSLGQDPRWRHALVAAVRAKPEDQVLDVATGTGMVARTLERKYGCRVIGLDQSADMLAAGSMDGRPLVRAQGERLPFADESFDHVTFTYLLRYVDDPAASLRELVRVLRPGGRLAALEFGVPANPVWRLLWRVYTRIGLPLAGRLLSTSWRTVGDFLGPSIEQFYAVHPQAKLEYYWRAAGLEHVKVRRMSLGGGTVMSATKSDWTEQRTHPSTTEAVAATPTAFYARKPGGLRDYWTLVHPPYTAWHLSYVLLGAALAPVPDPRIVVGALVAFGLAVGIGAHAFDELRGRPLGTRIPTPILLALGISGLAVATALGVAASTVLGAGFLILVAIGVLLVAAYGFEIVPFHSDLGFAFAWGAFPVIATAYAVGAPPLSTAVAALGAALLSLAQRRLSTPVRNLRRRAVAVTGQIQYRAGSLQKITASALMAVPESALRLMWAAAVLIGAGVLGARWL